MPRRNFLSLRTCFIISHSFIREQQKRQKAPPVSNILDGRRRRRREEEEEGERERERELETKTNSCSG